MQKIRLSEVSSIAVSNVDKKIYPHQIKVRLCNYVDVYHNWAITSDITNSLMESSANENEFRRFHLQCGDVALTKDSETRDDIGKSTYIADIPDNIVLGYHCALIRPNKAFLDGKYLNALFHTDYARRYFELNAGGSGQRFYLSMDVLNDFPVILPPLETQKKIGDFFAAIDRIIELDKLINDNLSSMVYEIYMHMFFCKSANGVLGDIIVENVKSTIQVKDAKSAVGDIPFFTSGSAILEWHEGLIAGRNCFLNTGGNADVKFYVGEAAYSTDTWCIAGKNDMTDYLYLLLFAIKPELNQKFFKGTGLKHLQKAQLRDREIYIPSTKELHNFNCIVQPTFDLISSNMREIRYLSKLRDCLLPMLINGQVVIAD